MNISMHHLGGQPNIPIPSEFIVGSTALEFLGIPGMLSVDPLNFVNNSGLISSGT